MTREFMIVLCHLELLTLTATQLPLVYSYIFNYLWPLLKKLVGTGHRMRQALDASCTQYKKSFWIKQLRTTYLHRRNVDLPLVKYKCKPPKNICIFHFFEKAVELNLPSILNNTQFVSSSKDLPCNFVSPNVIHNLQPMRSSTFNLWNFVLNMNVDQFLTDLSSILSNIVNSPFKDF